MSKIPPKPNNKYPWYLKLFFLNQKRKYGSELEPAKVWARSPWLFLGVASMYGALDRKKSPVDSQLRALITVRVSQINWCEFCVDINSSTVLQRGGSDAKLEDLAKFQESKHFTEKEKAALEYAEAITYSDRKVTGELFERLKVHFTDDEIVELTGLISFQNLSSKFNSALDIAPQGFCRIAPKERG
jgi:AhpD family alkylhydroperoxidase